ncbi:MAG: hypothetical protein JSW25_05015, partial [Thermoplasmata archaeon]
ILDFGGLGLVLEGASGTTVKDVTFQANDYSTYKDVSLNTNMGRPRAEWRYDHPGIIKVMGGSPTFDGVDISINGSFDVDVRYRKTNVGGGITLDVEWALVYVDSKETVDIEDLTLRDSTIEIDMNVRVVDMSPSTFDLDTISFVDMALFRNYRDVSAIGINVANVNDWGLIMNLTGVDENNVEVSHDFGGIRAVHAFVTETFSTAGPHSFDLEMRNVHLTDSPILYHHLDLDYSGTVSPTFDSQVLVDNVSALGGEDPMIFEIVPKFPLKTTIYAKVTVSNATFKDLPFSPILLDYYQGPGIPDRAAIVLHSTTMLEDSTFTRCHTGTHGLVNVPNRFANPNVDQDDGVLIVRNCVFTQNTGTLLNVNGTITMARDRLVIDGNRFDNNTAWRDQRTINILLRTEVEFTNNTFSDNNCSSG